MSQSVISLKEVTKVYQIEAQKVEALRGVTVDLKVGQMVGVTGRSGSGKSTLLHVVGTLDKPTSGEVLLNGTNISGMPDQMTSNFRNSTVGFIFQMNNLLPEFSALENVMMPGLIAGASAEEMSDRAGELLNRVGLGSRLNHRPGELSGGEQQRVAIGRALLMAPPILLADEPTGNLDKKNSDAVMDLLLELSEQNGVTMLLVTHDLDIAGRMPAQMVMEDGRILDTRGAW
ncbi:MAG: lipoprotein-releasing system ATP-binding protein LolD [Zetaproteobacteria bacterium]|nr:lipoprotein-releasing system ATP-binding protein LolD [Pseudobdellovibrionaceae bacterium]